MNSVQDLKKFEVPVFFIRPSRMVSDRIDAKIVFFEPEELPSLCILSHLPLDECFTLHNVEDGHAHLAQSGVDTKVCPEFPQESWDSQDAQAKALLAPTLRSTTQCSSSLREFQTLASGHLLCMHSEC
ncbi:hypothetical protein IFM61392_06796 [Aspergillus lentulus]|nr:hypothetical protein IFM61392_06796 [Aspergillus lentulus]